MRAHVVHSIDDLGDDLRAIAKRVRPEMRGVVRDGVRVGTMLAKQYAREKAGPHGKRYYKRINGQMNPGLGLFGNTISGEYGPTGVPKSEFVGVGFRSGTNTDLARTTDVVGPAFSKSVRDQIDEWFW